jgi:hypothetical protein
MCPIQRRGLAVIIDFSAQFAVIRCQRFEIGIPLVVRLTEIKKLRV